MRLSDSVSFGSFVSGRSLRSSLVDVTRSARFVELLDVGVPVEPQRVGLREFAERGVSQPTMPSGLPSGPSGLPAGSLGGYSLVSSPDPEVLDVASQRAARFGRSLSESDLDVAGMGR